MKSRSFKCLLSVLCVGCSIVARAERQGPWTRERAWKWYYSQPWIRGCNYIPSGAANVLDQWQELGAEQRFAEVEREAALMEKTGFNAARIFLAEQGFAVWSEDPGGFMKRFERTLSIFAQHGIRAIVVLGNDCSRPKALWRMPKTGPQPWELGYHGGVKRGNTAVHAEPGYTFTDVPELRERFYAMCTDLITKYAHDPRVLLWNLWNEPGMSRRATNSVPVIRRLFETAWKIDPDQPLAADVLAYYKSSASNTSVSVAASLSDVISYHSYEALEQQVALAKSLKEDFGRPLINTEWLARSLNCTLQDCYPFFAQNRIGCTCWGLVAGKYQTYEPYECMWRPVEEKDGRRGWEDCKLSLWFHDLYRPSHHPYDPEEIEIVRRVNAEMDAEYGVKAKGEGEGSLRSRIAKACKITGEDMWHGYRRTRFDFHGRAAWVVEPSAFPAEGCPWTWTMREAESFVDRTGVLDLLRHGYHHVTVDLLDMKMDEEGLLLASAFQAFLVNGLGLAPKSRLVGMDWGGFFSARYAAAFPENVAKIYFDAPRMPVDVAERIAAARIPVLLIYGEADMVVPPKENGELFAERFRKAGGSIRVVSREMFGHHPHGLDPDKTAEIVSFFEK